MFSVNGNKQAGPLQLPDDSFKKLWKELYGTEVPEGLRTRDMGDLIQSRTWRPENDRSNERVDPTAEKPRRDSQAQQQTNGGYAQREEERRSSTVSREL